MRVTLSARYGQRRPRRSGDCPPSFNGTCRSGAPTGRRDVHVAADGAPVQRKENIVREEMDRAGAQEVVMPSIQPAELWQESGRWEVFGPTAAAKGSPRA